MFDWIGGRKMFFAIVILLVVSVAFFIGKLEAGHWLDAIKWILAVYLGANAVKAIPDALARKNGNGAK